jgi:hypothetical protein
VIGAVVTATLPFLQSQAESLMVDTCTITRLDPDSPPVFDPQTGGYTTQGVITVYSGKCRVSAHKTRFDRVVEAGAEPVSLVRLFVDVPVQDISYQVDDIAHVDSSVDPAMVGLDLRVRQPEFGSQITARRLGCELDAG